MNIKITKEVIGLHYHNNLSLKTKYKNGQILSGVYQVNGRPNTFEDLEFMNSNLRIYYELPSGDCWEEIN